MRSVTDLAECDPVGKLTRQMQEYLEWYDRCGAEPFFHRKSQRVVLALLHVKVDGESHYVRGINSEVSLPTGTICAERAAIVKARTDLPGIRREHMKGIAVLEVPADFASPGDAAKLHNPLPPCGACREWLEKIQEESPEFYVLTFPDLTFSQVHERFLFWSEEEESMQPEDLGPWTCRQCGERNVPMSRECRGCAVSRFSLLYNRAPTQQRFFDVLRALYEGGPMSEEDVRAWLVTAHRSPQNDKEMRRTLARLVKNEREDSRTGEVYGRLVSRDAKLRYSLTETGERLLNSWNSSKGVQKRFRVSAGQAQDEAGQEKKKEDQEEEG